MLLNACFSPAGSFRRPENDREELPSQHPAGIRLFVQLLGAAEDAELCGPGV